MDEKLFTHLGTKDGKILIVNMTSISLIEPEEKGHRITLNEKRPDGTNIVLLVVEDLDLLQKKLKEFI